MKLLLFGIAKDIVGKSLLDISASGVISDEDQKQLNVEKLKQFLMMQYPGLQKLPSMAIAVNNSYAENDTVISERDEIALIPPVSGG
jgi:molybdopterin synthase sulfur carrier subunit